jgi:hypothetical protein
VIDASKLLADLQRLLRKLEADLRQRCRDNPEVDARARAEYDKARNAGRTSQAYEGWREEFLTQVAVAWILGCVFVRFIEDNQLLDTTQEQVVWLAGPGMRAQLARDRHTLYFREHPKESDREYLEHVFSETAKYPGTRELFDDVHNPLWSLGVSGDGATELLNFWQQLDGTTGELRHDFTDAEWNTRFLGDLYQDLSEPARKKYALLQTPIFVEEFILDRTLTPAINEVGYETIRLIDPACGSGHFLLGCFERLFNLWLCNEPGVNSRALAQRALNSVYGVDLNPFAVAIARFRLLIAALRVSDIARLQDASAFEINLAVGDSLLHGPPRGKGSGDQLNMPWSPMAHVYLSEDKEQLDRILVPGRYHAVVGNPPYITVKDAALNRAYRERFGSCHMKYSLGVPFMQRFFDLAINDNKGESAGYVGMITANSFMKREFGKRLIEQYIPRWDLTHVIDTAGAFIPGHGTPTVVLFGRNRTPVAPTIRTVMGTKGEPSTPTDPALGKVWTSITTKVDLPNTHTKFVSVADTPREKFHHHPWSIGGGGAAELKETIDRSAKKKLVDVTQVVGVFGMTNADDAMLAPREAFKRHRVEPEWVRECVAGERVRDYSITSGDYVIFPYKDETLVDIFAEDGLYHWLWRVRTVLGNRATFSKKTYFVEGRSWWEWHQVALERIRSPLSINFAEIASHNHFVLARGERVFNRTAPIIKLPKTSELEYLPLLALLNSSTVCFWMKQVAHQKQMMGGDGIRIESKCKVPYQFSGTQLGQLPIPEKFFLGPLRDRLHKLGKAAEECANRSSGLSGAAAIKEALENAASISRTWEGYLSERLRLRSRLIFLQEEIDFTVYWLFGLTDESLVTNQLEPNGTTVEAGERPFCLLAEKNEDGFAVPKDIPQSWPEELRAIWRKRLDAIAASPDLKLIEDAHYKRRWIGRQGLFNSIRNTDELPNACRDWMLNRLEDARYWPSVELTSIARLADRLRPDTDFMSVAEIYRGRSDFDVASLVAELVKSEAVPFLPVLVYKPSGLRHRAVWERVWHLQRKEDEVDARLVKWQSAVGSSQGKSSVDRRSLRLEEAKQLKAAEVGDIPVPPKYRSADFLEQTFWRLRGKLDVPKERFVSYPYCERDADQSLPIAWAGWDHLQQAKALANYYESVKATEGWGPARLVPLLAGILELLPWLMQWHNELDPAYGIGMGDFFKGFVEEEARLMGLTLNRIRDWTPPE